MADSVIFKPIALVAEHDIEAENMCDTDETGFAMGHSQSRRVIEIIRQLRDKNEIIFPADLPELNLHRQTLQDGSREFAAICYICADGTFLDSVIIFKAQNLQDSWFSDMSDAPKDILFGVSPNGWTDNSKALAWLERSYGPGSASEKGRQLEQRLRLRRRRFTNSEVAPAYV